MSLSLQRSVLRGSVTVSGAKNSALRLMVASILTSGRIELNNYPNGLLDAGVQSEMLTELGKQCHVNKGALIVEEQRSLKQTFDWDDRSIRNTLLMLGALTTRFGHGKVPVPGGCQLGERKYDLHIMLLEAFGAKVTDLGNGWLEAEAKGNHLIGTEIHLPIRSTGATENAILCGTLAQGRTRIWNPHIRPEIIDLISLLRKMGAVIEVRGQESIIVDGVGELSGATHSVIPDNVEALTWLIGAVITKGEVEIVGFPYEHLEVPLIHLKESGARFYKFEDRMIVKGGVCYPIEISTGPYPGINSDMQPLFAVYGAVAKGESRIIDLRFPGRYAYCQELAKMGMHYGVEANLLKIQGGNTLTGSEVRALDLRAGAALFLAGLVAEGPTKILDSWQILRGYDQFESKAHDLSAQIHVS
jgi:UDP-N-acetylglucosamine 1-carboxyvinyltransferase